MKVTKLVVYSSQKRIISCCLAALCAFAFLHLSIPAEAIDQQTTGNNSDAKTTEIHIKNADLGAIIKIFSKKTKRNYILDDKVKGRVSIYLPSKVSSKEAIRILDAILALKGYTAVPIGTNLWKIISAKQARKTTVPTVVEELKNPTATVVTKLFKLKHVSATDVQKLISQLISSDGLVTAYGKTNSLIIIDFADNIARIEDIIRSLDIPSTDTDLTIIPIKNADAMEIADTLQKILEPEEDKDKGESSSRTVEIFRSRLRERGKLTSREGFADGKEIAIGTSYTAPKIIPDERTNSIILIADETDTLKIRALIAKLDSPVDLSSHRFYVYRCQHADAEVLAEVLGGLVGEGGTSTSRSSSRSARSSREESPLSSRRSSSSRERLSRQRRTPGRSRSEGKTPESPVHVAFGEDVSITADPSTNSLIISSSKSDYDKILELLKQLDIKRRQVLVEAVLLEVTLNDSTSVGTEFVSSTGGADRGIMANQSFNNLSKLLSDPTALADFSIAAASAGTITLPGNIVIPSQAVLLSAARQNTNVNVLSAPNILTTDNEEAEIVVGRNVPFLASTSTSSTNLNNTFNQVERQDVGITLRLTPQISSGDTVTLNIFTEVSSVIEATANSPLGPTTTIRTSETTVITRSGQMIAIGGLISDDVTSREEGVPFLSDIPVLGHLFRTSTESKRQTNLLIFITPKIIKDQFDARETTVKYRDKVKRSIEENGIEPDRKELLDNFAIDTVAEPKMSDIKPGTIIPPRQKREDSLPATPSTTNKSGDKGTQAPLKVTVSPSLPPISDKGDVSANMGLARFYLFKAANKAEAKALVKGASNSLVGVELPQSTPQAVLRFFQPGQGYIYKVGNKNLQLKCIGVYPSRESAETRTGIPSTQWRILSPYEIMNLGKGPWYRMD
ncbi:MAG: type II secretion system protein GspD [Candidatus Dadabacteria bacterium]|nr:MAG: type II secretion system protein GspD [Candidatus Dadabacteria bacterium]